MTKIEALTLSVITLVLAFVILSRRRFGKKEFKWPSGDDLSNALREGGRHVDAGNSGTFTYAYLLTENFRHILIEPFPNSSIRV